MDLPFDQAADLCAEACAAHSALCIGFDVMAQYGYEIFTQCRIYGRKADLTSMPEGYRWNQDERNEGWMDDVINDGDGVSDTFCVGKLPKFGTLPNRLMRPEFDPAFKKLS